MPIGFVLAAGGYRLVSGQWTGVSQIPHRCAALAGLGFIGLVVKYVWDGKHIRAYPEGYTAIVSGLLIASWFIRMKYRPRRKKLKPRAL